MQKIWNDLSWDHEIAEWKADIDLFCEGSGTFKES